MLPQRIPEPEARWPGSQGKKPLQGEPKKPSAGLNETEEAASVKPKPNPNKRPEDKKGKGKGDGKDRGRSAARTPSRGPSPGRVGSEGTVLRGKIAQALS